MDAAAGASNWRKRILNVPRFALCSLPSSKVFTLSPFSLRIRGGGQAVQPRARERPACSLRSPTRPPAMYQAATARSCPASESHACAIITRRCGRHSAHVAPPIFPSLPCSIFSRLQEDVFGVVCGDRGPRNTMVMAECAVANVSSLLNIMNRDCVV